MCSALTNASCFPGNNHLDQLRLGAQPPLVSFTQYGRREDCPQYLHCTNHSQVLFQLALLSLSFRLPHLGMAVWMPLQSLLAIHVELECTQCQRWSCCVWPFPATLLVSTLRDVTTSHARFGTMTRGSHIWEKPGIVHTGYRLIPPASLGSARTSASCLVWAVCFLNYPLTSPHKGSSNLCINNFSTKGLISE